MYIHCTCKRLYVLPGNEASNLVFEVVVFLFTKADLMVGSGGMCEYQL